MKYTIDSNHREYFLQHQAIEFDALLDSPKLQTLNQIIGQIVNQSSPEKQFVQGRDLWRQNEFIRKIVMQKKFARIASELTEQKIIRLGYDQLIPAPIAPILFGNSADPYYNFLNKTMMLSEFSGLQGTVCGLLLCVQGVGLEAGGESPFSTIMGNGVFISPDCVIDFKELYNRPGYLYFLIVYCQSSTVYIHQNHDLHADAMRNLGYSYGDKLKDKFNPILLR